MADRERPSLTVEERPERGSRPCRRLRRAGYVPGIVYGAGTEPLAFKVGARDLRIALQDPSAVLDLEVGGGSARPVIVKEEQRHPVRDEVVHVDLLQVRLDETIEAAVMVELEGAEDAPGVVEGGVLEHVTRELNIEALPTSIPERIVVDVSSLQAAETLPLAAVTPPSGVTFLDDPEETVIATVTMPTQIDLPEEVEEETEIVGEEAVVTDVPAEGEGQPSGGSPTEGEAGRGRGSSTP
ncbi:MAG: 50S ribosomal protein L25 [Actinomycetota bacterium]|nr:50S ribosomal protein L25 [Actinomycetota bacterium]